MRLRPDGAKLNKARRGALYFVPASGYEWDPLTARFRFDPDEQVQRAIRLVFERFRLDAPCLVERFLRLEIASGVSARSARQVFSNERRRHSTIRQISPAEFERRQAA